MSKNIEFKRLCTHAARIKNILKEGYHLKQYQLSQGGGEAIYLVQDGKQPSEGVYICSC